MDKKDLRILWRCLIVVSVVFTSYFSFKFILPYIYPFLISLIISFMINPLVSKLEFTLKIPRTFSTLFVLTTLGVFLFGMFFLLSTEVINSALFLADKLPSYFQSFLSILNTYINTTIIPFYEKIISYFYSLNPDYQETISDQFQVLSSYVTEKGAMLLQHIFMQIPVWITILPSSLTVIMFIILATFFLTNDWNLFKKSFFSLFPNLEKKLFHIYDSFKKVLLKYIKAQLILIFITGCFIYSGLLILNISHALTLSLIIALVDLLPVIGTGLIFIPWIIYLFLTGDYGLTIGLSVVYMLIIVMRQLLEPRMITASIGVNPLIGLIILFISIQALGGIGLIIAPLLLILLAVLRTSGAISKLMLYIKGDLS